MIIRDYQEGDIYRILLNKICQYDMQYMREDILMNNIAFTGVDDKNNIIGCAGLAEMWDGVYEAWIALDERYKKEHVSLLKVLKNSLDNMPEGVVRIHAHMNINTENQEKLMKFLGFEKEAVLRRYYPGKADCILYRRLY